MPEISGLVSDLILFFEGECAGFGCEVLGFGAGVFAATQRAERINFTYGQAFFIGFKKWTDVRQLTAGAAAGTGAFAVFGDR